MTKTQRVQSSLDILRGVTDYFSGFERCQEAKKSRRAACLAKLQEIYNDRVREFSGKYVPPDYWCFDPQEVRTTKEIRGKPRVVIETVQDCKSMNREFIEERMLGLSEAGSTFESFLESPRVVSTVRSEFEDAGLLFTEVVPLSNKTEFIRASIDILDRQLVNAFMDEISAKTGFEIGPDVFAEEFVQLPHIQKKLSSELELEADVAISLDWDTEEFLVRVVKPAVVEDYRKQKEQLLVASDDGSGRF